jgi:hypothetical protein
MIRETDTSPGLVVPKTGSAFRFFGTRSLAPPGDAMHRRLLPPEFTTIFQNRGGALKAVRSKAEPWNERKLNLKTGRSVPLLARVSDPLSRGSSLRTRNWVNVMILVACVLICGCHDRTGDFKPSNAMAENALVRALEDWKAGKPAGEVAGSKPLIYVTDVNRNPKQSLDHFKILGEKPSRSGRTYAVELSLKHPDQQLKTEYIVVGIDPLWVYRREDFELLMHWDHHMPELPPETKKP